MTSFKVIYPSLYKGYLYVYNSNL